MNLRFPIFFTILLLSACSDVPEYSATMPTSIPTRTPATIITPEHQNTETPQPTPTYHPITPVAQGTRLPEHGNLISVENIDQLTLLSRWGQGNPTSIAYTPDGKYLVVGTETGLYFYTADDYSFVHSIDTSFAVVYTTISPDSEIVAIATRNGVLLYQISDWQLLISIKVNADSLDFSPDGQILALGIGRDPSYLQLRDVNTGKLIQTSHDEHVAWAVKISPRGNMIATGGFSTTIWALDGAVLDQSGPYISGGSTKSVSFSPDGEFLAEGSDYDIRIWRVLQNGQLLNYRKIDLSQFDFSNISDVSISPDGKSVAATLSQGVGIWDLSNGSCVFFVHDSISYRGNYKKLAWSMDSKTIAVTSNKMGVEIWNIAAKENIARLNTPSGSFSSLAWSSDGQIIGVGAQEGTAYLFDSQNGNVIEQFSSDYRLNGLTFSPDSQFLALGYGSRTAEIWAIDGTLSYTLENLDTDSKIAYSSDGSFFVTTLAGTNQTPPQICFWHTSHWSLAKSFPIGNSFQYLTSGFVLAPNQSVAAVSYTYKNSTFVRIISLVDGANFKTLEPKINHYPIFIDSMAYSPDGSMFSVLAANPDPILFVWRTDDWSLVYRKTIRIGPRLGWNNNWQDTLAWSPDGTLIAIGLKDSSIRLFNAINGEKLTTLTGHTLAVTGVSFSPNGNLLVSTSLDGTVRLWGTR